MDEKVLKRVSEHAQYVEAQLQNCSLFFTALQGSQNYNLADKESDVDTKSLVIPSLRSLIFDSQQVSKTLIVEPTEEHADAKDIRGMFDCFRKQNPNFIEILFTPYVYVNPKYQKAYDYLHAHRDEISRMNMQQTIKATCGHIHEKYKKITHPFPSRVEYIEKYGYDPKQLHHMYRLKEFLIRFLDGEPFSEAMVPKDIETLLAIKRGSISCNEALAAAEEMNTWALDFMDSTKHIPYPVSKEIDELLDEVAYDIIRSEVNGSSRL